VALKKWFVFEYNFVIAFLAILYPARQKEPTPSVEPEQSFKRK
jgi:hypothetical protein